MTSAPMIKVSNLRKEYVIHKKEAGLLGSIKSLFVRRKIIKEAVKDVSFSVEEGEILGLVGANGAGKTTLVKMMSGIIYPTSGEARVLGFDPSKRENDFRRQIALIMGQKAQLWWDLPAADCFLLLKEIYKIPNDLYQKNLNYLAEVLSVGNELNVQIRRLSLGERMKMELIAALLHNPKVVFLDEPTIGLDLTAQRAIRSFILDYQKNFSPAMILTSHYMEDIERLAKRIIILRDGEIIYEGSLQRVVEQYAREKKVTVHLKQEENGKYQDFNLELMGKVLEKNEAWPGISKENPDRLIFRRITEDEARVTAMLNRELDIGQFIPPHLVDRVKAAPGVTLKSTSPVEVMFLAMNPKFKPWDSRKVRQAVAYAINREAIIKAIFRGGAEILHGPIGPGQYGYTDKVEPKYEYNPEKARQLLKEAGYPDGVQVDFHTASGRYINDRQSSQAIVPMLEAVGFKVNFHTPEYSSHWPLVRKGERAFYYQGRGSVVDPAAMLAQYFVTGVTPRIMYSNPELDELLKAQESEFDEQKRRALLLRSFNIIQEELPAFFLWRIQQHYGISDRIEFEPTSTDRVYGTDIIVRK